MFSLSKHKNVMTMHTLTFTPTKHVIDKIASSAKGIIRYYHFYICRGNYELIRIYFENGVKMKEVWQKRKGCFNLPYEINYDDTGKKIAERRKLTIDRDVKVKYDDIITYHYYSCYLSDKNTQIWYNENKNDTEDSMHVLRGYRFI